MQLEVELSGADLSTSELCSIAHSQLLARINRPSTTEGYEKKCNTLEISQVTGRDQSLSRTFVSCAASKAKLTDRTA